MEKRANCKKNDCFNLACRLGFCRKHYEERKNNHGCLADNCSKPLIRNNLCRRHYAEFKLHKREVGYVFQDFSVCLNCGKPVLKDKDVCSKHESFICCIEDCDRIVSNERNKLCSFHYKEFKYEKRLKEKREKSKLKKIKIQEQTEYKTLQKEFEDSMKSFSPKKEN
jgi:hypothetical protein